MAAVGRGKHLAVAEYVGLVLLQMTEHVSAYSCSRDCP